MKVAYLTYATLPSRKAHSIHVMRMCSALAENGHEVTLWYPGIGSGGDEEFTTDQIMSFYGVRSAFALRRIPRFSGQWGLYATGLVMALRVALSRPDLVLSRFLIGSIMLSRVSSVPSLLELHQPVSQESRFQHKLFRRFIQSRAFHRLIVITQPLKGIFLDDHPMKGSDILVLADGADPTPEQRSGGPEHDDRLLQVGYFGHLYPGRGIEIIQEMARRCPWAEFHIVGGLENDIERVRAESKDNGNVRVHGFVSPEKAASWRMEMDVLVSPYQRKVGIGGDFTTEKWMSPLKVFEYMAAGKPIICSDIPVLREVLDHESNCLLCIPDDVQEWVAALTRLREEPELAAGLAEQAVDAVTRNYLWTVRAERILREGPKQTEA